LEGPFGNGKEFPFRLLPAKSNMKILKGHLPVLPIQMKNHSSQLPSQPKGDTLREKVDKEAEPLEKQVCDVSEQRNHSASNSGI
jgi:hypothetical protein